MSDTERKDMADMADTTKSPFKELMAKQKDKVEAFTEEIKALDASDKDYPHEAVKVINRAMGLDLADSAKAFLDANEKGSVEDIFRILKHVRAVTSSHLEHYIEYMAAHRQRETIDMAVKLFDEAASSGVAMDDDMRGVFGGESGGSRGL